MISAPICRTFVLLIVSIAGVVAASGPDEQVTYRRYGWSLTAHGQYSNSFIANSGNDWGGGGIGVGFGLGRRVESSLTAIYHTMHGDGRTRTGVELVANFRGLLWRGRHLAFYADGGAGIVYSDGRYPAGGTHFNFTEHLGLGLLAPVADDLSLAVGVRYQHLSNADYRGDGRNPGIDGMTGYLTLSLAIGD